MSTAGHPGDDGVTVRSVAGWSASCVTTDTAVRDLRAYLLGTWGVTRSLHDADLGAGRFEGRATFSPDGEQIAWHESGRMRLGSYDGPARRELRIVPAERGWEVRFADGRAFHALDLDGDGQTCALEHPCGDDRYTGELRIDGPDAFEIGWRVSGPRKEQSLRGRYVRAPR
jgi:Family of unknown function (DUF6314)